MKKFLSLALALVLLCGCMFTLASCGGGLSGKYSYTDPISGKTTYEFKGKEFTRTYTLGSATITATGTYEITEDGDQSFITFTYTDGDEEAKEDGGVKLALSKGTEDGKDYIKFGKVLAVKYIKE
ncbi:MAG: hypothetical protein IJZ24_03525 [Clostridia bacterium]|nr:hypothetical protein [Clostridia bacterium]